MKEALILRSLGCIRTNEEEQKRMLGAIPIEGGTRGGNNLLWQNICEASLGRRSVVPKLSCRVWGGELRRCLLD